ncbi:type I DNA topoisomerase [Candidatus Saganbacteria bacterium]|nr:type I DNA topoisomerase [Candidatus Saganbacteria bacterium]
MKSLVIVESPAKAKTLEKFLGKNYSVLACGGHVMDLPGKKLGVDVEHDFKPSYVTIKGKSKIINSLKAAAKTAATIFLAPDPDREGEAIAWHLADILDSGKKIKRIEFHEITKEAVTEAVKNPRTIDMKRVDAQQARRILDRLVGYKISPLLWKKVRKGLSAGRVQSVAVKLIVEREKKIRAFIPQEYWSIEAYLNKKEASIVAKYLSKDAIPNQAEADKITNECKNASFAVSDVKKKEQKRNPSAPFITSTLQQEAARKLGYSARKTMTIAQQLYEGVDLQKEGHVGLITYMRTDSVRIANEALSSVREYIAKEFGKEFLPEKPNVFKTKKSAQDAHEAIRPSSAARNPQAIKDSLTPEQFKLYNLIWMRFVACQMNQAIVEQTSIDISAGSHAFRTTGSIIKFFGFMKLYEESKDEKEDDKEAILPDLKVGDILILDKLDPKQHFTEPPPRYSEASLIKELEEKGIGRPSTYAPILYTIETRGYVTRESRIFKPTELGETISNLLEKHFPNIMDYEFTAHMEDELDEIVEGKLNYVDVLKEFYDPFAKDLERAYEKMETLKKDKPTDEKCPTCGQPVVIRNGRFGEFLACSGFPKCKFTKAITKSLGVSCTREGCSGEILVRRTRHGKVFYSCSNYPECKIAFWDRPIAEKCPKCSKILVEKALKNKIVIKCSDKACDYEREKE